MNYCPLLSPCCCSFLATHSYVSCILKSDPSRFICAVVTRLIRTSALQNVMIAGNVTAALGNLVVAFATNFGAFFFGRFIMGIGSGLATTGPIMYCAEVSTCLPDFFSWLIMDQWCWTCRACEHRMDRAVPMPLFYLQQCHVAGADHCWPHLCCCHADLAASNSRPGRWIQRAFHQFWYPLRIPERVRVN